MQLQSLPPLSRHVICINGLLQGPTQNGGPIEVDSLYFMYAGRVLPGGVGAPGLHLRRGKRARQCVNSSLPLARRGDDSRDAACQ